MDWIFHLIVSPGVLGKTTKPLGLVLGARRILPAEGEGHKSSVLLLKNFCKKLSVKQLKQFQP